MNKAAKVEFLKNIMEGKIPREAVNPPKFELIIKKDGIFYFHIDGKQVTHDHYLAEKKRLHITDDTFTIELRKSTD